MQLVVKYKKTCITLSVLIMVITLMSSIKAYSLDDVRFVIPYLETDNFFNDVLRILGKWIYDFMGGFLTYAEEGFTSLMNWDIMKLPIVNEIMQRFDIVLYSLLFIAFIIVVIVRMFMFQNTMKVVYNVFMTMMIISSMTIVLGLMSNAKNDLVAETNAIIKGANNDTMAVMLYKENTVDIEQSMRKGSVVKLSDIEGIDLGRVNTSLRIKGNTLNEYYTYNENGVEDTKELNDGMFGMGDERYYRYRTDYFSVNITIMLSTVVFILAIFKLAYLVWQWFSVNVFGKLGLAKGFWDLNNIGKVLKNALNTLGGMVILYFSMMLFSVLCASILSSNDLDNWLVKAVIVFAIGMAIVVGSGFVNDFLGIDDGSNFALKSVFMAQRLGRMGKGMVNSGRNVIGAPIRAMDKGNEVASRVESHFKNDNTNNRFNSNTQNESNTNSQGYPTGRSGFGGKGSFNDEKQQDRNKRFQDFYDNQYSQNNGNVDREKELYEQSKKRDDFREYERGSKKGYINQRKYKPYKSSNIQDDEDLDELERNEREQMLKRGGK